MAHMRNLVLVVQIDERQGAFNGVVETIITLKHQPSAAEIFILCQTNTLCHQPPIFETSIKEWKLAHDEDPVLEERSIESLAKLPQRLQGYTPPATKNIVRILQDIISEGACADLKTLRQVQHHAHNASEELMSRWIEEVTGSS